MYKFKFGLVSKSNQNLTVDLESEKLISIEDAASYISEEFSGFEIRWIKRL